MDNQANDLPTGNNSNDLNWTDPLDHNPLLEVSDEDRFNNQSLILKSQREFFETTIESIKNARVNKTQDKLASKHAKLIYDGFVGYLLENISWSLYHHDPQQANNLFRRLHNNFFLLTQEEIHGRDILIKLLESLLFELCLKRYPNIREKLIIALFDFDKLLAQKIDQATQPSGLKKIVKTITGQSTALIGHDDETGSLQLQLEHKSDQLLLTGPTAAAPTKVKIEKPKYPGNISNPEVMGKNIDGLVKNGFDIAEGILNYSRSGREAEALGQLFTAIGHIVGKDLPIYCVTEDKDAQKAIKPFRLPQRLKDEQLNIFGNILVSASEQNQELRQPILSGVKKLVQANPKLFEDFQREFFFKQAVRTTRPVTETQKPVQRAPEQPTAKPAKAIEAVALDEDFSDISPLDRLEKIYLSGSIDFRQLSNYDPYARGVLSLILCGKKHPLPEELDSGYRKWQHLVHPDKNPTELAKEFSRAINEIGQLARRQEFIRDKATDAVRQLFELTQRMLDESSFTIVPRQGERHIILTPSSLTTILSNQKYELGAIKVFFHGQLVERSAFDKTLLSAGDTIEVVTF